MGIKIDVTVGVSSRICGNLGEGERLELPIKQGIAHSNDICLDSKGDQLTKGY